MSDDVICEDSLSVGYYHNNLFYEILRATSDVMPLVMLEHPELEIRFQSCIHDSIIIHDGFSLDVAFTGIHEYTCIQRYQ